MSSGGINLRGVHEQAVLEDYRVCLNLAQNHYENFPVVSFWLPSRIRHAVAAIYAFARRADDFADEGDDEQEARLVKLEAYRQHLSALERGGRVDAPGFLALADAVQQHDLPMRPLYDLLSAFSQDVTVKRYLTFDEVQDYCRRSANPVGQLMLTLHGAATAQNLSYSDAICSALQWINFLQDIEQDYVEMQRIYIPQEDMQRFGVTAQDIANKKSIEPVAALVLFQINRVRQMLLTGLPLEKALHGRFKWIIAITVRCGIKILNALEQAAKSGNVFTRPRVSKMNLIGSSVLMPYKSLERMRTTKTIRD